AEQPLFLEARGFECEDDLAIFFGVTQPRRDLGAPPRRDCLALCFGGAGERRRGVVLLFIVGVRIGFVVRLARAAGLVRARVRLKTRGRQSGSFASLFQGYSFSYPQVVEIIPFAESLWVCAGRSQACAQAQKNHRTRERLWYARSLARPDLT